jgi:predicted oxidoreductase
MRHSLHPNGPEFSRLSVGLWRLNEWNMDPDGIIDFIEKCLEMGITTFDHADIYGDYGNESLFGEALKKRSDLRDKIELVSKCGICLTTQNRPQNVIQHYNTTSSYIRKCVEDSLQNLHIDYLDLILIHRPDPLMSASELADIFQQLIDERKIKHVGVSNFTPSQFDMLQSELDVPLVSNQVECSLLHLNPIFDGTFDQAQKTGVSPMIWSPLAGGRLFHEQSEQCHRIRNLCSELSESYNASLDQLALAWLLMLPSEPQLVLGTGKPDRIRSAVQSLSIKLERQDWFKLLKASRGHDVA